MELKIQIISFIFSFVYGALIAIIHNILTKFIKSNNKQIEILNNFFFMMIITLVYFKTFLYINNGIINIYFLIITFLSFVYIKYINFTKKM